MLDRRRYAACHDPPLGVRRSIRVNACGRFLVAGAKPSGYAGRNSGVPTGLHYRRQTLVAPAIGGRQSLLGVEPAFPRAEYFIGEEHVTDPFPPSLAASKAPVQGSFPVMDDAKQLGHGPVCRRGSVDAYSHTAHRDHEC